MELTLDTLKIYERLRAADVSDKAAKEIAEVIKDVVSDQVVTKHYFDHKLVELEHRLAEMELRLKHDLTVRLGVMLAGAIASVAAIIKFLR